MLGRIGNRIGQKDSEARQSVTIVRNNRIIEDIDIDFNGIKSKNEADVMARGRCPA